MKLNLRKIAAALFGLAILVPSVASAQEKEGYRLVEPEQTVFKPYWFMQAQVGAGYTINESPKFLDGVSPAAALNFGYRAVPWFGFRFGFSGWQGKGYMLSPDLKYKWDYAQGNIDAMISLTNLFCGFNPKRCLDVYLAAGIGGAYGWHNNQAEAYDAVNHDVAKLWTGHRWFLAGRAAVGMDINLSNIFAINIEANGNLMPDSWNSKNGANSDWQLNVLAGVTVKFGKNHRVIPAVYEELPPAPKPVEPKPEPKPEPVKPQVVKPAPMTQNIFFVINSHKISTEEMQKVAALSEYMKKNTGCKVTITGYADKETGNAAYNMLLSKRRSEAVAKALEASGIAADRISVDADGDTVQPFPVDEYVKNRVAICITKD